MKQKLFTSNVLFEECIKALGDDVVVFSVDESARLRALFKEVLPITRGGRIHWEDVEEKVWIDLPNQIIPELGKIFPTQFDGSIYVFWNNGSVPVIKTDLNVALKCIDDVICVGLDTWFLNLSSGYVVEFYHLKELVIGGLR